MSDTRLKNEKLEINDRTDNADLNYRNLLNNYSRLEGENQILKNEARILKDIVIENAERNHTESNEEIFSLQTQKNPKLKPIFYVQIILGIGIIVLSLGFHLLYMSVADCLLFEDGAPTCWYKSWMGIEIHASFYIDLMLYSLITLTSILIILIIKSTINKKS